MQDKLSVKIPISIGELFDKITILQIKSLKIKDPQKLNLILFELKELSEIAAPFASSLITREIEDLLIINLELWKIEDELRELERKKEFDAHFILLARSVYKTNDKRSSIKNQINNKLHSFIEEVKSYQEY